MSRHKSLLAGFDRAHGPRKGANRGQKFFNGDLVFVTRNQGYGRDHFNSGYGIIVGSYADQFGGNNVDDYSIYFGKTGTSSWYPSKYIVLKEQA